MVNFANRIVILEDKKTSMHLADEEWEAINIICEHENIKRNYLFELINQHKNKQLNLTHSLRIFTTIYLYYLLKNISLQKSNLSKEIPTSSTTEAIKAIL